MIPLWLRPRCAFALKHRKLQYKVDLTPPKCKRNSRSRHFVLAFNIENQHFPLKSSLGHPWDPRAPASSQMPLIRGTSKMVFGHNLRYMAPFDFSRAGFCMVFRRASFVFSCPGADFGGPGRILDPQVVILARGFFLAPKNGPEKSCFVEE